MGRYVFKLPDVGEGTAEAEVVAWHVAVGDRVAEEQTLVEVMTDKATVEIPSPAAGVVLSVSGPAGGMIAVGAELVVLEVEGEGGTVPAADVSAATAGKPVSATPAVLDSIGANAAVPAGGASQRAPLARGPVERPIASPAVRRRAWELGVPLQFVTGSGPGGRILHGDLDRHAGSGGRAPAEFRAERHGVHEVPVRGLRRKIAESMQLAKRRIPHFSYIEEVDVTALEELRRDLNARAAARGIKLSPLPFLVRALVQALGEHPQLNARYDDEAGVVQRFDAVHAGIATQTPGGLMVPVLRHAEALDLWQTSEAIRALAATARDGKATRDQLTGSTITITSLGALGGVATTPIINHPEVAIVGLNKIVERPVVRSGLIQVRAMMNLSCSFDHRVVDGWDAAEFVQRLKGLMEQPALLFMEPSP